MHSHSNSRIHSAFALVSAALLLAGVAMAEPLIATPSRIVIDDLTTSHTIALAEGATAVPASQIQSVQLRVGDEDYSGMLKILRDDGTIKITPTSKLEVGAYELVIQAAGALAVVAVDARLQNLPDSLSNRAAEQGLTERDVLHQLGLYSQSPRTLLNIDLPAEYAVGRRVVIPMNTAPSFDYAWYVNGALTENGTGPHTFVFPLRRAGEYAFEYVEREGGIERGRTVALTRAVEEAPIPYSLEAGTSARFRGPEGYSTFTWLVDGDIQTERSSVFLHHFGAPGSVTVECIAAGTDAESDVFRTIRYVVEVTPRSLGQ